MALRRWKRLGVALVKVTAAGVGLVVAGSLQLALRVRDLHLETLACSRLLGDRAECLQGRCLLLDLEGCGIAPFGQALARLLADLRRTVL